MSHISVPENVEEKAEPEPGNEFDFYFQYTKPLVLELSTPEDRAIAAAWVQKLEVEPPTEEEKKVRLEYLKLLLFVLQRKRLTGIFKKQPPPGPFQSFPQGFGLLEMGSMMIDQEESQSFGAGDARGTPYTIEISNDLREFVAAQEIPNFGVQMYYAWSSEEPVNKWSLFDEDKFPPYVLEKIKQLSDTDEQDKDNCKNTTAFPKKKTFDTPLLEKISKKKVKSPQEIEKSQGRSFHAYVGLVGRMGNFKDDCDDNFNQFLSPGQRQQKSQRQLSSNKKSAVGQQPFVACNEQPQGNLENSLAGQPGPRTLNQLLNPEPATNVSPCDPNVGGAGQPLEDRQSGRSRKSKTVADGCPQTPDQLSRWKNLCAALKCNEQQPPSQLDRAPLNQFNSQRNKCDCQRKNQTEPISGTVKCPQQQDFNMNPQYTSLQDQRRLRFTSNLRQGQCIPQTGNEMNLPPCDDQQGMMNPAMAGENPCPPPQTQVQNFPNQEQNVNSGCQNLYLYCNENNAQRPQEQKKNYQGNVNTGQQQWTTYIQNQGMQMADRISPNQAMQQQQGFFPEANTNQWNVNPEINDYENINPCPERTFQQSRLKRFATLRDLTTASAWTQEKTNRKGLPPQQINQQEMMNQNIQNVGPRRAKSQNRRKPAQAPKRSTAAPARNQTAPPVLQDGGGFRGRNSDMYSCPSQTCTCPCAKSAAPTRFPDCPPPSQPAARSNKDPPPDYGSNNQPGTNFPQQTHGPQSLPNRLQGFNLYCVNAEYLKSNKGENPLPQSSVNQQSNAPPSTWFIQGSNAAEEQYVCVEAPPATSEREKIGSNYSGQKNISGPCVQGQEQKQRIDNKGQDPNCRQGAGISGSGGNRIRDMVNVLQVLRQKAEDHRKSCSPVVNTGKCVESGGTGGVEEGERRANVGVGRGVNNLCVDPGNMSGTGGRGVNNAWVNAGNMAASAGKSSNKDSTDPGSIARVGGRSMNNTCIEVGNISRLGGRSVMNNGFVDPGSVGRPGVRNMNNGGLDVPSTSGAGGRSMNTDCIDVGNLSAPGGRNLRDMIDYGTLVGAPGGTPPEEDDIWNNKTPCDIEGVPVYMRGGKKHLRMQLFSPVEREWLTDVSDFFDSPVVPGLCNQNPGMTYNVRTRATGYDENTGQCYGTPRPQFFTPSPPQQQYYSPITPQPQYFSPTGLQQGGMTHTVNYGEQTYTLDESSTLQDCHQQGPNPLGTMSGGSRYSGTPHYGGEGRDENIQILFESYGPHEFLRVYGNTSDSEERSRQQGYMKTSTPVQNAFDKTCSANGSPVSPIEKVGNVFMHNQDSTPPGDNTTPVYCDSPHPFANNQGFYSKTFESLDGSC